MNTSKFKTECVECGHTADIRQFIDYAAERESGWGDVDNDVVIHLKCPRCGEENELTV